MPPKPGKRLPAPTLKVSVSDLSRILGTHGRSLVRHEVESMSTPEHKPYIKLLGESDEEARVRHEKEGRAISAIIWDTKPLQEVLDLAGMSITDWCKAVDRLDFALRLEHHAAFRAMVGASLAVRITLDIASDDSNDVETRLRASLGLAKSYAKHDVFRSKITETLTKERSELDAAEVNPAQIEILDEVIRDLTNIERETEAYNRSIEEASQPQEPVDHTPRPKSESVLAAEARRLEELKPPAETNLIEEDGGWTDEEGNPIKEED